MNIIKQPDIIINTRNIKEYKPYGLVFGKNAYRFENNKLVRNVFYYERSWFCNENKMIHHSEKETLNCPYCSKIWYSE